MSLVDEDVDVAPRIGRLPDSSLIATRIGNDVRRVVVASPAYLAAHPVIREPAGGTPSFSRCCCDRQAISALR